jgi:elongation factor G
MTSGTGSFTRHFVRYEAMPAQLADKIRAEHAAR